MPGSTKKKNRLSVNNMLLLLIIVMFIPFLIISIWACDYIRKETTQTFESNLTRFTHNTAMESVNRSLDEIELAFTILASRVNKQALDEYIRPEQSILNSIVVSMVNVLSFFDAVLLSDTNNNYSAYPELPPGHYVPSERPWYPPVKKRNEIVYSEPYGDSYNHKGQKGMPTITVSMNLFQNNVERIGNIAFDLDLAALSEPLQDIVAPFHGKFMVAAKNGSIVMHPNLKEIFHITVPLRWIEQATELEGYFFDDETQKFVFYRSFSNPSWVAFTIVDKKEYDNYVSSAPLMLISVFSICVIIYVILFCFLRVYIREIINRLYMGLNGINYDGQSQDLEQIYTTIKKSHHELSEARRISSEDALTGIGTRRKFDDRMQELIESETPFYLAIIDLDNFKRINDTYGHDVGDNVLRFVSKTGKAIMEPDYPLYRFGGEELIVLFPGIAYQDCFELLECWRETLCSRQWRETGMKVSFSCGIAERVPGVSAQEVLIEADRNLYAAKRGGKNVIFGPVKFKKD